MTRTASNHSPYRLVRPMLKNTLQRLAATGSTGFEGLIQRLLERLTGYQFYLAQSGTQAGRDMSSARVNAAVLAVECKRYGDETELKAPELLGKLAQAAETIPQLDVWVLVTSRSVPDQLYSALQRLADRLHVDVQVLSAGDERPNSLEVLCAHSPDIVISHLQKIADPNIRAIEGELARIAADPEFLRKCDRIKALLTNSAGYDAARHRLHEWLLSRFNSEANSRVALGQAVDVNLKRIEGRLVPRATTNTEFDQWLSAWPTSRCGLAVLGEEGDGKTWAVASWLSAKLSADTAFSPTLWLSSREVIVQDFEALIADALAKRLGGTSINWIDRLRRWSAPPSTSPLLIVILDGINERHNNNWWRPIIESLGADPWRNAIAPIVTARTGFWPALARLPHIHWADWTVPPFNDGELNLALRQIGVRREELPDEILELVRKPRYFDLAVRHRSAMAANGDVTVARLIYEDWRDRDSRRAGLPDEGDFQKVIMDLAMKTRQDPRTLEKRDLLDTISSLEDRDALLRELETGGILVQQGRHWRVEPSRLALGFGLLLAERLRDDSSVSDPAEVLASLMEPQPDIDLKAAILESATLHSLERLDFPIEIRSLLLAAWLTHRNAATTTEHSVAAYFPLNASAYLNAAESIWADSVNDGWAEQSLKAAYSRWSGVGTFVADFERAFERWLGFVHIDGSPVGVSPEKRSSRRTEITAILGRELVPGPFQYAGIELTAIEDDGLLRLGRVALAIISERDRRPYIRALTTADVTDALMQFPDRLDLCRWIIRTSRDDLWPLLKPEVDRLIRIESRSTLQAAYRLLGSIGTARALARRAELPEGLFPTHTLLRQYEADPCSSGFAWRSEHCTRCAKRADVPTHLMARQLAKCVRNPDFVVPATTCQRLATLLGTIEPSQMWKGIVATEQEYRFESVELAISSCNPDALADFVRAMAREVPNRQGLALRQLACQLVDYRLTLTREELTTIHSTWNKLRQLGRSDDRENERAESFLFELLLHALPAEEQLDRLLERHPTASLLTHFRPHFKQISWSSVSHRLRRALDSSEVSRILFFASAHHGKLDRSATEDLTRCANSRDRAIRVFALKHIYLGNLEGAGKAVIASGWRYNDDDQDSIHEDHWGSLILAKWGQQLPYDELRTRIKPTLLGRAVLLRGLAAEEVDRYAEDLDGIWSGLGMRDEDPDGLPAIELRTQSVAETDELELPGVPRSAFSRTITFLSHHASWGGAPSEEESPGDPLNLETDTYLEQLHETLSETLSKQRKAHNLWFAQRFGTDCLAEVIASRPELVCKWIGDPIGQGESITPRIWLARSFYEALCEVLLTLEPRTGVELYRVLQLHSGATRFVQHGTDIELLDYALFAAKECEEVRALWDSRLEQARSDRDLLVVATLAQSGTAETWLLERISNDLASTVPFLKTRAILLRGFINTAAVPSDPITSTTDVIDWQREQHERAIKNWKTAQWARSWFNEFMSHETEAGSVAAFRLFLSCVDSRFSLWREEAMADIREDRRLSVLTSANEIGRSIQENEKSLRKAFVGMPIAERQVWPWC